MTKPIFMGLAHICVIVDNISEAFYHYKRVLGAEPYQYIPNYKSKRLVTSLGFVSIICDISIGLLKLPNTNLTIEVMQYHDPQETKIPLLCKTNVNSHITLKVSNIEEALEHIASQPDIIMISSALGCDLEYTYKITPNELYFFTQEKEADIVAKQQTAACLSNIKFFHFVDKYGLQWILEQDNTP